MNKNCMLCANREVAFDQKRRVYSRCALDRDMRVNARMCCDEWTERIRVAFATNGITRKKLF